MKTYNMFSNLELPKSKQGEWQIASDALTITIIVEPEQFLVMILSL